MCFVLAQTSPALPFDFFGLNLFGSDEAAVGETEPPPIGEPVPYTVSISVTSSASGDEAGAISASRIESASALFQGQSEPAIGVPGLLADARGDYRRILGALYGDGRYGSTIEITANGREVSQIAPDADLSTPVDIAISVDPGPAYVFGSLRVDGAPTGAEVRTVETRLDFAAIGFVPGELAQSGSIRNAESQLLNAWKAQGYALAQLGERTVEANHPDRLIDVTLRIDPGPPTVFGAVQVQGAKRVDPEYIVYIADIPTGAPFDPKTIRAAEQRLAGLQVFRSVRIQLADAADSSGAVPINIFVQERKPRRIGVGGTVSSVDGVGLEAFWLHRNLLGRAERFRLDAKVSGINSADPEDFSYTFGGSLTQSGIFTPDTVGSIRAEAQREVLEAYTKTGGELELALEHPFSPMLTGRLAASIRYAEFDDDVFGEREFTTSALEGQLTFDGRDDPADATSGVFLQATATPIYEFSRGEPGVIFQGEARAYQSLGFDDRLVAAGRLKAGTLFGPSIANTAPDRLFFAGGGGSVRGYAYRNIGVEQPSGDITGGRFLLEGSAELRARFTDTWGGAVFADAGYVDEDSFGDFSEDLKISAGAGVRYITPLGPIRFDVGVPLDPGPDDPDFGLYLGIGQAF
ncbi:MAG: autotransporter assembly complex family protein [Pseudomonadota bacterium]